jgi:hypothetical protein
MTEEQARLADLEQGPKELIKKRKKKKTDSKRAGIFLRRPF